VGQRDGEDVSAALSYLKQIKTPKGEPLVGDRFGLYGVELGGYAALKAAAQEPQVKTLVLDSIPNSVDDLINAAVAAEAGTQNSFLRYLGRMGTRIYFSGQYENTTTCEMAGLLRTQHVFLLSGPEAGYLRNTTAAVARCFPNVEVKTDLPLTGFNLPSATGEQGEGYDRRVIDFFDKTLRAQPEQSSSNTK
jgi:hypothetical protein